VKEIWSSRPLFGRICPERGGVKQRAIGRNSSRVNAYFIVWY
jgi:hypothetical protein